MEYGQRDNKKRVREGNEDHMIPSEKHAKTSDDRLNGNFDLQNEDALEYNKGNHSGGSSNYSSCITGKCSFKTSSSSSSSSSDSHDYCDLGSGVFDFPWLKEDVISKTDNHDFWNFEDIFSSTLEYDQLPTTSAGARTEFSNFSWQCLYDETDPDKKVEHEDDKSPKIEEDVCHAPSS